MTGWNLPPGCNISDLPGNSREEQEAEALYDGICADLEKHKLVTSESDNDWYEKLVLYIMRKMGDSYGEGYMQGMADEAFANEIQKDKNKDL